MRRRHFVGILVGIALALLLGATAEGGSRPLPIASLRDVTLMSVVGPSSNVCGLGTVGLRGLFTAQGREYGLLLLKADALPTRFVILDMAEGDETLVWVGYVRGEELVVTRELTYRELLAAPVCAWLTERVT